MSRIEEALRRSDKRDLVRPSEVDGQRAEVFESPWEFGGAESRPTEPIRSAPVATPVPAPVPAPVPVPSSPAQPAQVLTMPNARLTADSVVNGFNSQFKQRLVVSDNADAALVEEFRRLAAILHQGQIANGLKTVMVTSASPNDGKTLTAINLALILSESYKRQVLLIDADLRRPSIRDVSHVPDVMGLADALKARADHKLTVFRLTQNLSLLPAGRPDPDPMGGLTSARMRTILDDARQRFDWVILDAPPVGTVADASLLAEMIDGALLVVRAGQTDSSLTLRAVESIGRERILGVVLNDAEPRGDRNYYQSYETTLAPTE
jgi:capsular exopolysaccharide synthesis family protein